MAGAAVGVSSGDFSKAGQNAVIGGAGGFKLGTSLEGAGERAINANGSMEDAVKEYSKNHYDLNAMKRKRDEEIKKKALDNKKLEDEYRLKLEKSREQYEEFIEKAYKEYEVNKIADDDIVKTEKFLNDEFGTNLTEEAEKAARKKIIAIAKLRKNSGLGSASTKEQMEFAKQRFSERLSSNGVSNQQDIDNAWELAIRYDRHMNE